MERYVAIGVSIEVPVLAALEAYRRDRYDGLVPRSVIINQILRKWSEGRIETPSELGGTNGATNHSKRRVKA